MLGERTSELVSFEMRKLMAGAVLVSPYIPMLFMGEEYSEPHPFLYFVSHTDPELAEAVRKGRKAEFSAFHAQGEAPDPVSKKTFDESKLQWELIKREPHQTMFDFYKTLIKLRKQQPALCHLDRNKLDAEANEKNQTLLLHRWHKVEHIYCLLNFSKKQQQLTLPDYGKELQKIFDSADPAWNGPAAALDVISDEWTVTIQPESFLIYKNTHD
jgi:maltooligosyltrehalose trehalohydrolase